MKYIVGGEGDNYEVCNGDSTQMVTHPFSFCTLSSPASWSQLIVKSEIDNLETRGDYLKSQSC